MSRRPPATRSPSSAQCEHPQQAGLDAAMRAAARGVGAQECPYRPHRTASVHEKGALTPGEGERAAPAVVGAELVVGPIEDVGPLAMLRPLSFQRSVKARE